MEEAPFKELFDLIVTLDDLYISKLYNTEEFREKFLKIINRLVEIYDLLLSEHRACVYLIDKYKTLNTDLINKNNQLLIEMKDLNKFVDACKKITALMC